MTVAVFDVFIGKPVEVNFETSTSQFH
jgi:hypothetical protein